MFGDSQLDKSTPIPLYYQLKTAILDSIKSGEFGYGEMIPTELELSAKFDISRTTVRQAVTELVHEGYLYRIKSKGTFVSKPKVSLRITEKEYNFKGTIESYQRELKTVLLEKAVIPIPDRMIELGGGVEGDSAIYVYRERFVDNTPFSRVKSYLPYDKFHYMIDDDMDLSMLEALMMQDPSSRVYRRVRLIEALIADKEDTAILKVKKGAAIQKMSVTRYNAAEELLDYSYAYYRGDMNSFEVEVISEE